MNHAINDFHQMCVTGYGCGLKTVAEAYSQYTSHYDVFFKIEEAADRIGQLEVYIDQHNYWGNTLRDVLGQNVCDIYDAEEAAYWEGQK